MKVLFLSLCLLSGAIADPVSMPRFLNYENVQFQEIIGDSVKFTHKNGIGRAKLAELPKSVLEKLKGLEVKKEEEIVQAAPMGEIQGHIFVMNERGVAVRAIGFKIDGKMNRFPDTFAFIRVSQVDLEGMFDGKIIKVKCAEFGNMNVNGITIPCFTMDKGEAAQYRAELNKAKKG